jgi:hypothetical protein
MVFMVRLEIDEEDRRLARHGLGEQGNRKATRKELRTVRAHRVQRVA